MHAHHLTGGVYIILTVWEHGNNIIRMIWVFAKKMFPFCTYPHARPFRIMVSCNNRGWNALQRALNFFLQLFIYFLEWGGGLHGLKIIIIDFSADDTCFLKEFFEVNIANHEISAVSVRHVTSNLPTLCALVQVMLHTRHMSSK